MRRTIRPRQQWPLYDELEPSLEALAKAASEQAQPKCLPKFDLRDCGTLDPAGPAESPAPAPSAEIIRKDVEPAAKLEQSQSSGSLSTMLKDGPLTKMLKDGAFPKQPGENASEPRLKDVLTLTLREQLLPAEENTMHKNTLSVGQRARIEASLSAAPAHPERTVNDPALHKQLIPAEPNSMRLKSVQGEPDMMRSKNLPVEADVMRSKNLSTEAATAIEALLKADSSRLQRTLREVNKPHK